MSQSKWLNMYRQLGLIGSVKRIMKMNICKEGTLIGEDKYGNKYFSNEAERVVYADRWIEFAQDDFDASQVPPEWHSWLHHIGDAPGIKLEETNPKYLEDHVGNKTGTSQAYHPHNYLLNKEWRPLSARNSPSYEKFIPETLVKK